MFMDKFDGLGKRIGLVQKDYETLVSTRRRMLERPLDKIDDLRAKQGLQLESGDSDIELTIEEENE
jgi:DNA recombination protein RmuC